MVGLYRPVLLRAGVAALVLVPFCTEARTFTGAGPIEWSLAALVLAVFISAVQTLVDSCAAARGGRSPSAVRSVSVVSTGQPSMEVPVAGLLSALPSGKVFDDLVRRALTHLGDPTKLSLSPLLQLSLITTAIQDQGLEDSRLQRVAILKALLTDMVDGLRPQQRADSCISAGHRFYNCLYYPYVRGITRRSAPAVVRQLRERREQEGGPRSEQERVVEWLLQVNEDTYYKWQRRASDTIALILRERENLPSGAALHYGIRAATA
jgi:hypothetical protein